MKAKDVIGRTIVEVQQEQIPLEEGGTIYDLRRLVLDNGACVFFSVQPLDDGYAVMSRVISKDGRQSKNKQLPPCPRCDTGPIDRPIATDLGSRRFCKCGFTEYAPQCFIDKT